MSYLEYLNKNNILNLFFIIFPFAYLIGNFGQDLIISLFALFFFFVYKVKFFFNLKNFLMTFFFFIFPVIILISSIFSLKPINSFEGSLFYLRFILSGFFLAYIFTIRNILLKILFFSCAFSISILILDSFYQYFSGANILNFVSPENYRLTSFFNDKMIVGTYVFRILPIILIVFFLFYSSHKKVQIFVLLLSLSSIIIVFLSGERTAFFLISLFFLLILISINFKFIYKLTILIIISLILSITLMNSEKIKNRMVNQTFEQISGSNFFILGSPEHQSHYMIGINMFKDRPIIGHGPKLFRHLCSDEKFKTEKNGCSTHPHNIPIQLLAETGLSGFLFYIFFYSYIVYNFLKYSFVIKTNNSNNKNARIVIYALLICYFFPLVPSNNIFGQYFNTYLPIYLGVILYLNKNLLKFFKNSQPDKIIKKIS